MQSLLQMVWYMLQKKTKKPFLFKEIWLLSPPTTPPHPFVPAKREIKWFVITMIGCYFQSKWLAPGNVDDKSLKMIHKFNDTPTTCQFYKKEIRDLHVNPFLSLKGITRLSSKDKKSWTPALKFHWFFVCLNDTKQTDHKRLLWTRMK